MLLSVCAYPLIVARQRLGRNVTAVTNTYATIEELLDASFSMWPVSYQGKNFLFSTLKMEAICSSETSVDYQPTLRRYIPEDSTLHYHRCENLK
jgi:hypothetical protein